jgi:glycosyltransferase involved in cell wall biosynthesis
MVQVSSGAIRDAADRARRLAHLLREHEFRRALADSARRYICEKRSLERIGKMYEEVYRFAAQAKKQKKDFPPNGSLVPAAVNL